VQTRRWHPQSGHHDPSGTRPIFQMAHSISPYVHLFSRVNDALPIILLPRAASPCAREKVRKRTRADAMAKRRPANAEAIPQAAARCIGPSPLRPPFRPSRRTSTLSPGWLLLPLHRRSAQGLPFGLPIGQHPLAPPPGQPSSGADLDLDQDRAPHWPVVSSEGGTAARPVAGWHPEGKERDFEVPFPLAPPWAGPRKRQPPNRLSAPTPAALFGALPTAAGTAPRFRRPSRLPPLLHRFPCETPRLPP